MTRSRTGPALPALTPSTFADLLHQQRLYPTNIKAHMTRMSPPVSFRTNFAILDFPVSKVFHVSFCSNTIHASHNYASYRGAVGLRTKDRPHTSRHRGPIRKESFPSFSPLLSSLFLSSCTCRCVLPDSSFAFAFPLNPRSLTMLRFYIAFKRLHRRRAS